MEPRSCRIIDYSLPAMSVGLMVLNFNDSVLTLFHLRCVAPHLQADENFDVAGVAARLGGADTPLAKGGRELRPLSFQFAARTFLVGEALPQALVQAQSAAHLRCRAAAGFDVESGNGVGDQERAAKREKHRRWKHLGSPASRARVATNRVPARRRQ